MDDKSAPAPPTFVEEGARRRSEIITLEWPVEYDGRIYRAIAISRMTTAQYDAFMESARTDGEKARLPMFSCPSAVIDALDADDAARVNEVVLDFLPRALQPAE